MTTPVVLDGLARPAPAQSWRRELRFLPDSLSDGSYLPDDDPVLVAHQVRYRGARLRRPTVAPVAPASGQ